MEEFYHVKSGATPLTRGEGQAFARRILNSSAYRADIEKRAGEGRLPPAVEVMLWHYAYGKPVEHVQVSVTEDYDSLPIDELARRAKHLTDLLQEAVELAEAIPPEMLDQNDVAPNPSTYSIQ